jgi:hypothetical protein
MPASRQDRPYVESDHRMDGCGASEISGVWFHHRRRGAQRTRQNLGEGRDAEKPDPDNLLASSTKCPREQKALLLAMATPVQVRPVEAWDLLDILSRGSEAVLGGMWSEWQQAETALELVMG